jgi:hypothetical protein
VSLAIFSATPGDGAIQGLLSKVAKAATAKDVSTILDLDWHDHSTAIVAAEPVCPADVATLLVGVLRKLREIG